MTGLFLTTFIAIYSGVRYLSNTHRTVDSYLQGPKQVKDRENCNKKVSWPLSKKKQKITNNIPFLKLFFPKGSDHPQGHFLVVVFEHFKNYHTLRYDIYD